MIGTLRLAWIEFARAFRLRFAPGGRDLMWFTLLLAGLQLHGLVILAAREGILEQSVNAFLGYEEGHGVPVWVLPNSLRGTYAGNIDADLVASVREAGFGMEPYRRFRTAAKLRLPSSGIWRGGRAMDTRGLPRFAGLAVDTGGPLWPGPAPAAEGPWPIVLNATTFARYFDLSAYRAALDGRVPEAELAAIPDDPARITELPRLWLEMRVHKGELAPFEVTWAPHITIGAEQIAYVAPLDLWHLIDEAARNPATLCLFPEGGPGLGRRILTLRSEALAFGTDRRALRAGFAELAEALGGTLRARPTRMQVTFGTEDERAAFAPGRRCDPGLPEGRVLAMAAEAGLPVSAADPGVVVDSTRPVRIEAGRLLLPCDAVPPDRRARGETQDEGGQCLVALPLAERDTGFEEAFLYAASRLEIGRLLDFVLCRPVDGLPPPEARRPLCLDPEVDAAEAEPDPRLRIDEVYEDALTRYNFLTDLIEQLRGPIGLGLFGLLLVILWVQIGTILGHRRLRYAMLLCNGATWGQIRLMVVAQGVFAATLALALAVAVFAGVHALLEIQAGDLAARYPVISDGVALNPLPLGPGSVALVGGLAISASAVLLLVQARLFGISRRLPVETLLR